MRLSFSIDTWALKDPFITAKDHIFSIETLTVFIRDGERVGRGEALGVDYLGETAQSMSHQVMGISAAVDAGIGRAELQTLLPPGGARNAVDCALWDLECKHTGERAWERAGLGVRPLHTLYTLSLGSAESMAQQARDNADKPALKFKLDGDAPAAKIMAVRSARPDAELVIDANGGWTPALLSELLPTLKEQRIALLEQPLERGADEALENIDCPVPLCADESCQNLAELPQAAKRYDVINIKLDKCGGLTEALAMLEWCRAHQKETMVGNMLGSSLAMAPGFLIAQQCRFVDLDGPLWQCKDRSPAIEFDGSLMNIPPPELWG